MRPGSECASAVCQGLPWSSLLSSLCNFVISNNCFHFINLISHLIKLYIACHMKISAIGRMFTSVVMVEEEIIMCIGLIGSVLSP